MKRWHYYQRYAGAGLAIIALVVGIAIVWFHRTGLLWAIPRYIQHAGFWGIWISYGLVVLQSIVPYAPFALVAGFNTAAHGFFIGFMVSFAGVITGNLILFSLAKQIVAWIFHGKLESVWDKHPKLQVLRKKVVHAKFWPAFSILFILRVQPWVPSSLLDILSGATGVKFKPFFFSTLAGQAPTVAAMAYLGHRLLNIHKYKREIILFFGIALVMGLVYLFWWLWRKRRALHGLKRL